MLKKEELLQLSLEELREVIKQEGLRLNVSDKHDTVEEVVERIITKRVEMEYRAAAASAKSVFTARLLSPDTNIAKMRPFELKSMMKKAMSELIDSGDYAIVKLLSDKVAGAKRV